MDHHGPVSHPREPRGESARENRVMVICAQENAISSPPEETEEAREDEGIETEPREPMPHGKPVSNEYPADLSRTVDAAYPHRIPERGQTPRERLDHPFRSAGAERGGEDIDAAGLSRKGHRGNRQR